MAVQVRANFQLKGWNATQLKLRVPVILTRYDPVIGQQFQTEIKTAQFSWPRQTKRRNGATVSSPRDIVDDGGFLGSQLRADRPSPTQLRFTWNAPYANLILTGYTTKKGTVVPGRNWIKPALDAVPLEEFFREQWRQLANNQL